MNTTGIDAPAFMLYFAFIASLLLTLLKIWEIIYSGLARPTLNLRLTMDAFFRVTDWGEAFFCTPVLLAWKGPLLILDAQATMTKTNDPKKHVRLEILAFGEKVRGATLFADHYFPSKSPLTYIPESIPHRAVYLCVPKDYRVKTEATIAEFRTSVLKYKTDTIHLLATTQPAPDQAQMRKQVASEIENFVDTAQNKLMDYVQLEPGQYKFTLTLGYKSPASTFATRILSYFVNERSEATSHITFSVGPEVRDHLRAGLRQTLTGYAQNWLFDRTETVPYAEYQPLDVTEKE
jgi:hypothetical protein